MEHMNRTIKETIQHLGVNKTENAIVRSSKCVHALAKLLAHFDTNTDIAELSGTHVRAKEMADIGRIVDVLLREKVFSNCGNRCHSSYQTFKCNAVISGLDLNNLKKWMENQFMAASW